MKRFIIPFSLSGALLLGGCWHTDRMDSSKIRASGPLAEEDVRETKYYKNGVFRTDGDIYSVFHSGDWIFGISGNRMIESSDMVHWLRMGRGTFAADDCRVARNPARTGAPMVPDVCCCPLPAKNGEDAAILLSAPERMAAGSCGMPPEGYIWADSTGTVHPRRCQSPNISEVPDSALREFSERRVCTICGPPSATVTADLP